jgi:nucleoside-diphosphate-sugar epimerase
VLRVFNPLGRNSPARTLPGRAAMEIREALEHRRRSIRLGPLDSYRDYIDTRDVARAALLAGRGSAGGGVVLNVGRGEAVLSRDVIRSLARIAGYDGAIEESDDGSSRSARLSWQCADIRAIGERLGWRPRYRLEDSLRDLWDGVQGGSGLTPPLTTQGSNGL